MHTPLVHARVINMVCQSLRREWEVKDGGTYHLCLMWLKTKELRIGGVYSDDHHSFSVVVTITCVTVKKLLTVQIMESRSDLGSGQFHFLVTVAPSLSTVPLL